MYVWLSTCVALHAFGALYEPRTRGGVRASRVLSLRGAPCCRAASRWHIDSVITGQTKVEQMDEYLGALSMKLDEETLQGVEKIYMSCRNPSWSD